MPGAPRRTEASLPAFYRTQGHSQLQPSVGFAAVPFVGMSSPLQTALLRELELGDIKPTAPQAAVRIHPWLMY